MNGSITTGNPIFSNVRTIIFWIGLTTVRLKSLKALSYSSFENPKFSVGIPNRLGFALNAVKILGVFLPLITTNCCILGVAILVIQNDYDLLTGIVYAFATAIGFALAMILFAGIREQLSLVNVPKGMEGMSIALVTAGLLAMAFMGFSGVDKGLASVFGL